MHSSREDAKELQWKCFVTNINLSKNKQIMQNISPVFSEEENPQFMLPKNQSVTFTEMFNSK